MKNVTLPGQIVIATLLLAACAIMLWNATTEIRPRDVYRQMEKRFSEVEGHVSDLRREVGEMSRQLGTDEPTESKTGPRGGQCR